MRPDQHNENVDALRGIAALVVVIHHITTQFPTWVGGTTLGPVIAAVGAFDQEAVLLFFVISGYCIYSAILGRPLDQPSNLKAYGLRRALRILPPYWLAIALTAALMKFVDLPDAPTDFSTLIGNLLFLQTASGTRGNWFPPFGANGPLWSISYEVFYYALFPALVLTSRRLGPVWASLPFAAGLSIAAVGASYFAPNPVFSFLGLFFVWRVGAAARECRDAAALRRATIAILICFAVLAGLGLQGINSDTAKMLVKGAVIALLWITLQTYCVTPTWMHRLSIPAVWAGDISYSLYLVHFPILLYARETLGEQSSGVIVGFIASVAVAWGLERLCARLRNAALRHLSRTATPSLVKQIGSR